MITLRGWVLWGLVALVGCKPGDGGDESGDATGAETGAETGAGLGEGAMTA